jgi:hypothetical protein
MLLGVGIEIITVLAVNGATGEGRGISEMGPVAVGFSGTARYDV